MPHPSGAGPARRHSEPVQKNPDGRTVIDIRGYAPYYFASVNSALSRGASAQYLNEFGIGVTEWRVLSWIATEPGVPASRICEIIALDKGAVSRAINKLDQLDLLIATPSPSDPRRKSLELNEAGWALHDKLLDVALERESRLVEGVAPQDLEVFLKVMRTMRANVDGM
ncbi:MarR family winged helix-turn-helix transcriptional regulator [Albibacillus kandeliae]|uniref:MarR family winged helix-turn-helix transcriptional regulator n=1 Tax=Albibacillus kandeliae TaxID=2174228 RepID=UPI0013007BB5|nr:MarR family winged helix-turn-helix transcriptional regulator [Albibacillus kandeliae]